MSFSKRSGKNTRQCYTKPLDSLKNWNNRFFWVDERVFPTVVDWRNGMPVNGTYSVEAVRALDTHRTPIQKQPEMLLCLVEISRRYYLGDEVYPNFHYDDDRAMDLFSLIRAPNPTKVDEPAVATDSSGVPSTIEKSLLDVAHEDGAFEQGTAAPEMPPPEDVPATNAPGDHADLRPSGSSHEGKSLAATQLCLASNVFVSEGAPADVSDPDPLSFSDAPSHHPVDVTQSSQGIAAAGDLESENVSSPVEVGSPGSVYRPEWGVTNGSLLDTPEACQDLVDHAAPPGYFSEQRHMHNEEFLRQYNINLAQQVAMGSQLRLSQEVNAVIKAIDTKVYGEIPNQ
nr:transposase (putative), gypsy type [Tanacetum cinerariifolium]